MRGEAPRGVYVSFLNRLSHVSLATARGLPNDRNPAFVVELQRSELRRVEALARDLRDFYGAGGGAVARASAAAVSAEVLSFVAHLEDLSEQGSVRLTAQSEMRHLGSLSGVVGAGPHGV